MTLLFVPAVANPAGQTSIPHATKAKGVGDDALVMSGTGLLHRPTTSYGINPDFGVNSYSINFP
jgi:hypothetical protein